MNYAEKQRTVTAANQRRGVISDEKGPEYAGSAGEYTSANVDVLANFKRQDGRWGFETEGMASAFVYFGKHIDSIETFARELISALQSGRTEDAKALMTKGEGIVSRLDDARNYLDLIECLLVDAQLHPDYPDPWELHLQEFGPRDELGLDDASDPWAGCLGAPSQTKRIAVEPIGGNDQVPALDEQLNTWVLLHPRFEHDAPPGLT